MRQKSKAFMGLMTAAALALGVQQAEAQHNKYVTNNCDAVGYTWYKTNTYWLMNLVAVRGTDQTLVIEPGTVIRGMPKGTIPGDPNSGTLLVSRGGKIHAVGTPQQPIVFTDQYDDNIGSNPGSVGPNGIDYGKLNNQLTGQWGGLIMAGRTYIAWDVPTNTTPSAGMSTAIEGLVSVPGYDYAYGGGNDFDDSGELDYISIRYGGYYVNATKEINGLTLCGVGRNTEIDHIEVYNTKDDALECFGGTVCIKHFLTWNATDDQIDTDAGFRGRIQFALAVQGISTIVGQGQAVDSGDKGCEWDGAGDKTGYNEDPQSCGTMWNYTLVGMGKDCGDDANTAVNLRHNAGGRLYNGLVLDFAGGCLLIDDFPFTTNSSFAKMSRAYAQDAHYLAGQNTKTGELLPPTQYMGYPDAIAGSKMTEIRGVAYWNMGYFAPIGLTGTETAATYDNWLGKDNTSAFGSGHVHKGEIPSNTGYSNCCPLLAFSPAGNISLGLAAAGFSPIRSYARETTVYNATPTFRSASHPYTCVAQIDPRLSDVALSVGADKNWSALTGTGPLAPTPVGCYADVDFPGAMCKKNWAGPWSTVWRLGGFVTNGVPTGDEDGVVTVGLTADPVNFTISVEADLYIGDSADYFCVANKGAEWKYLTLAGTWVNWNPGTLSPATMMAPLGDYPGIAIPISTLPSSGTWTIYAGVDRIQNNALDLGSGTESYAFINVVKP